MKKGLLAVILVNIVMISAFAQVDAPVPHGKIQIIDDFENGNYWIWAGFDWERYSGRKASVGSNLSKEHITDGGKYSMELLLEPVKPGSNAIWFYDGSQNLSGGKYIVADFYNDSPIPMKVSLVLQATDDWVWLETASYPIPPGKHTVVFDVHSINEKFYDIKRFNINANFDRPCPTDSSLFVDYIRLIK